MLARERRASADMADAGCTERRASADMADAGCTRLAAALAALPSRPLEMVSDALVALIPPPESLLDWATDGFCNLGGWVGQTLRATMRRYPETLQKTGCQSLEAILSDCGYGFDQLNEDANVADVLRYLRAAGLANGGTDQEIADAIESMEEAFSSPAEAFSPAEGDAWSLAYTTLQAATPDFDVGEEMARLWFPLDEGSPNAQLAECLVLRREGNFYMWACRTAMYRYLICFATS